MTTYSAIASTEIDADSPITDALMGKLRDNPIAIAEGASGAPYMQTAWHPYDGAAVGDGATGKIYDIAVNGSVPNFITPDFADGYEYRLQFEDVSHDNGASQNVQIELYLDPLAVFTVGVSLGALATNAVLGTGAVEIQQPRLLAIRHAIWSTFSGSTANTSGAGGGTVFYNNAPHKILKARISMSGGNFDGGKVYMQRRRTYI